MARAGAGVERLSWVVVTHDSGADVAAFLPDLRVAADGLARDGLQLELIVVDNASQDRTCDEVRRLWPEARVLRQPVNRGYGAAANVGLRQAVGAWAVVSNADLRVRSGGLDRLPCVIDAAAPDVALVGPALCDGNGRVEPSVGRFPNLVRLLVRQVRPRTVRGWLPLAAHRPGPADWITGACLLVRLAPFREAGGFDEDFFLYYEDVDLARRLANAGWRASYDPTWELAHSHPHHRSPRNENRERAIHASRTRYFRVHRPAWEAALVRVLSGALGHPRA